MIFGSGHVEVFTQVAVLYLFNTIKNIMMTFLLSNKIIIIAQFLTNYETLYILTQNINIKIKYYKMYSITVVRKQLYYLTFYL